jgi:hypothetical protein
MLRKIQSALSQLPELARKYRILKDKCLLDDSLSAEQLEKYLYTSACIGRSQGYLRSIKEGMCVDAQGEPIPWLNYPAIEQLAKWDFSGKDIFEYGCGNSTRWWAKRAKSVVSVEASTDWYDKILAERILPPNVNPILAPLDENSDAAAVERHAHAIDAFGEFDVIVIDGFSGHKARLACTQAALGHLRAGGMIILDNADWHPESARTLRDAGFLEIDYCGLGPLNTHSEISSFFLSAGFRPTPLSDTHPGYCIGGLERQLG